MAAPGYEQIRGLNVAMDDAFGMGGIECVRDVDSDGDYAFQIQRMSGDQMFQRRAIQVLHCDEWLSLLFANLIDCANVWVIQRRSGLRLSPKPFQHMRVLG